MKNAILKLNGKEYEILYLYYEFHRSTDVKGRPNGPLSGGSITVIVPSTDSTSLFWNMTYEKDPLWAGEILVYNNNEDVNLVRHLQFEEACIYRHEEHMETDCGGVPMFIRVDISPQRMKIDNVINITRVWPEARSGWEKVVEKKEEWAKAPAKQAEPRCTLHFRRLKGYDAEFGFDWLRGGDTGEPGDNWYRNIMPMAGQYDRLVESEYTHFEQQWRKDDPEYKQNYVYVVPWVAVPPNTVVSLRMKVEAEEVTDNITLRFRNNDAGMLSIDQQDITDVRTGAYYLTKNLAITCKGTFNKQIFLDAYMGNEKVGGLAFVPNQMRELPVALINVRIFNPTKVADPDPRPENNYAEVKKSALANLRDNLSKYLKQACIIPVIEDVVLDESAIPEIKEIQNGSIKTYYTDIQYPSKFEKNVKITKKAPLFNIFFMDTGDNVLVNSIQITRYWGSLYSYLDFRLKSAYGNAYQHHHRIYLINWKGVDADGSGLNGRADDIPSMSAVIFDGGITNAVTPTHELLHCLGLVHPFEPLTNKYQFTKHQTDNIMDYEDKVSEIANFSNRFALWYWQMKKIWEGLK